MTEQGVVGAMKQIANSLRPIMRVMNEFAERMLYGTPHIENERVANVRDSELGEFTGHICEQLSEKTCTIARASDGVLVTVERDSLVRTRERDDDD